MLVRSSLQQTALTTAKGKPIQLKENQFKFQNNQRRQKDIDAMDGAISIAVRKTRTEEKRIKSR